MPEPRDQQRKRQSNSQRKRELLFLCFFCFCTLILAHSSSSSLIASYKHTSLDSLEIAHLTISLLPITLDRIHNRSQYRFLDALCDRLISDRNTKRVTH